MKTTVNLDIGAVLIYFFYQMPNASLTHENIQNLCLRVVHEMNGIHKPFFTVNCDVDSLCSSLSGIKHLFEIASRIELCSYCHNFPKFSLRVADNCNLFGCDHYIDLQIQERIPDEYIESLKKILYNICKEVPLGFKK